MDASSQFLYLSRMEALTLADLAAAGRLRVNAPVGIIRCEPVWEFKPYRLMDFLLWCVLDGVGMAEIGGHKFQLGPGTCLLLPPGSALSATHDPTRRLRVFYLHADFLDGHGQTVEAAAGALPEMPVVVSDLSALESLARQVVESHATGTAAGRLRRDLALRLVLLTIHESARAPVTRSDRMMLAAALLAVRENPGAGWSVPGIAVQAGLSVSQTARRIRELTGLSPREFVIRARIERARRLMEESAMSLKQIAASLGYTDVYFFHRQFKAVAGVTPGRWRRERTSAS